MAPLSDSLRDPLIAASLLTRIPLKLADKTYARSAEAAWAYPLVGILTGALVAGVGLFALWLGLPALIAAILAVASGMILTGAMHEDGLADCADGLWGGWDTEMRLKIMKDSQIGTYGVLSLGLVTAIRVLGISILLVQPAAFCAIIAIHVASRSVMPPLMASLPHARQTGLARSVGSVPVSSALIAAAIGSITLILFTNAGFGGLAIGCAALILWRWIAKRKIGGQTGDVIGASQQIAETVLLLTLIAQ